jgi:hypothetical protein
MLASTAGRGGAGGRQDREHRDGSSRAQEREETVAHLSTSLWRGF